MKARKDARNTKQVRLFDETENAKFYDVVLKRSAYLEIFFLVLNFIIS